VTRSEVASLLLTIAAGYPSFMKDRDPEKTTDLWQRCFEYDDAKDVERAFIDYLQNDKRNVPPAPGGIRQYIDNSYSESNYIPDE